MAVNGRRKTMKILMVGPLPPPMGGIAVSFKVLVGLLQGRDDVTLEVVDFSAIRQRHGNALRGLLRLCRAIIPKAKEADVVTAYFASTALPSLGVLLLLICRILGKPLVLRKAANFDYRDLGSFKGRIAHVVVKRAQLYLAETKMLVGLARERGIAHVMWYPTNRPMSDAEESAALDIVSCRRFVFVGQVREYKGIREIIQAAERFGEGVRVDVYGPMVNDLDQSIFNGCKRVKYCGILAPEDVIPTLKNYDLLLLPTKAVTEGYPGAVFEGYAAGLPIITTRCGGIPEIVDESSGVFVEPGNTDALFDAMKTVVEDNDRYRRLREGVRVKRKEFDSATWADRFVEYCRHAMSAEGWK